MKSIIIFILLITIIVSVSGCTGNYRGNSNKQLSANVQIESLEPIALTIYNQNNFDWTNTRAVINDVWITEMGNMSSGDMKVLLSGDFEDEFGKEMPLFTRIERLDILSNEGRASYAPR